MRFRHNSGHGCSEKAIGVRYFFLLQRIKSVVAPTSARVYLKPRLSVGTNVGTVMALSVRRVETAEPGRHSDGHGLMLLVKPSGARTWVLRYQMRGRRRDMGLGPRPEFSLAMARERASEARRAIALGKDPLDVRPERKRLTFLDAAGALIAAKSDDWRNASMQRNGALRSIDMRFLSSARSKPKLSRLKIF